MFLVLAIRPHLRTKCPVPVLFLKHLQVMARYHHITHVRQVIDPIFNGLHAPGTLAPHSGIYCCMGCGWEVASNEGQPLPPQNHGQHDPKSGDIRWRLIVLTN